MSYRIKNIKDHLTKMDKEGRIGVFKRWSIIGVFIDFEMNSACSCGKEGIKEVWVIGYKGFIADIGSECVKHFCSLDAKKIAMNLRGLFNGDYHSFNEEILNFAVKLGWIEQIEATRYSKYRYTKKDLHPLDEKFRRDIHIKVFKEMEMCRLLNWEQIHLIRKESM